MFSKTLLAGVVAVAYAAEAMAFMPSSVPA